MTTDNTQRVLAGFAGLSLTTPVALLQVEIQFAKLTGDKIPCKCVCLKLASLLTKNMC